MADYSTPVSKLFEIGDVDWFADWLDYREFGIGPEHIPELARLAADTSWLDDDADDTFAFAIFHSWRALAQLGATDQLPVLLDQMRRSDCDAGGDLITEEFPKVLARLGPPVVPDLCVIMVDRDEESSSRIAVIEALSQIAAEHENQRERVIAALVGALDTSEQAELDVNAFVVSALLSLKAVDAAPAIEQAFAAGAVEEFIVGDWPQVRYELGLGPKPSRSRFQPQLPELAPGRSPKKRADERKAERKRRKQAQKRNRNRR
jgi:hypothetical protein